MSHFTVSVAFPHNPTSADIEKALLPFQEHDMSLINPNAKWDWYTVGGRWSGLLKLRDGSDADIASIGEIDFDRIYLTKKKEKKDSLIQSITPFMDKNSINLDEAIKRVNAACSRWIELSDQYFKIKKDGSTTFEKFCKDNGIEYDAVCVHDFKGTGFGMKCTDVEKYIEESSKFRTYAFIDLEGNWVGKGDMGWFGVSHDEQDDYPQKFERFLDSLKPTDYIAIVDCHI